ncbi:hypothetical protein CEXT_74731 [Caerostris extrusa]|uniref:Uncharacterized protein n=1 Tax=Caerostris extrusa TaxID=172846 RepID=A0AAV4TBX8_CAEEX|nr:hypothetical protein CEXT_74731 [Caerostris extrusa]
MTISNLEQLRKNTPFRNSSGDFYPTPTTSNSMEQLLNLYCSSQKTRFAYQFLNSALLDQKPKALTTKPPQAPDNHNNESFDETKPETGKVFTQNASFFLPKQTAHAFQITQLLLSIRDKANKGATPRQKRSQLYLVLPLYPPNSGRNNRARFRNADSCFLVFNLTLPPCWKGDKWQEGLPPSQEKKREKMNVLLR